MLSIQRYSALPLLFLFTFTPLLASSNDQETVDPTWVAHMNEEVKDLQDEVDKEFASKFPETPNDLRNVKNISLAIAGEGSDFDRNEMVKVFWKKTDSLDYDRHLEKTYSVLVVYPDSKTASFGRFYSDDSDFIRVEPGTYLKIDGKTASCDQCLGGSMDQMTVEMQATKLLDEKPFDLEMQGAVREKINQMRVHFEKGHPTQKRLLVFGKGYKNAGEMKVFDKVLKKALPLRELADKNNIQIIIDPDSDGHPYLCTMIAENKYKNLLLGDDDLEDLWDYCKEFFGLK